VTVEFPTASTGAIGLGPYGDEAEHSGPPEVILAPDFFRPFFATDARSMLITILPNHYNFIPNPAFRVDASGWEISGIGPSPTAYSWTFDRGSGSVNAARLNAIVNGTADAAINPDPSVAPAKQDGQLVLVGGASESWLVVDSGSTLTTADAVSVGLDIDASVPGYRPWDAGSDALSSDSWVGQSIQCYGTGSLRYRSDPTSYVYVGNPAGITGDQWDYRRGGPEYTYSVYAKGSGKVRLSMHAYYPSDIENPTSGPEYQNLVTHDDPTTLAAGDPAILDREGRVWVLIEPTPASAPFYEDIGRPPAFDNVRGPWTSIENDGQWHRTVVKTRARVPEGNGQINFLGCSWIDTMIEVEDASNLLISSAMLDSTEYPEAAFFDGGITEDQNLDDFLWEGVADDSVSLYYFDRLVRTQWLYERLPQVVPAGRPYQIFFGSYWRPFVGETGETIMMDLPPTPQGP